MTSMFTGTSFCMTVATTTGTGPLSPLPRPPRPPPDPRPAVASASVLLPHPCIARNAKVIRGRESGARQYKTRLDTLMKRRTPWLTLLGRLYDPLGYTLRAVISSRDLILALNLGTLGFQFNAVRSGRRGKDNSGGPATRWCCRRNQPARRGK